MRQPKNHVRRRALGLLALLASGSSCAWSKDQRARVSYGSVMVDVGHRFELVGKAGAAGRFELARYELGEISEAFESELPEADPPREGHPEVLPAMVTELLVNGLPPLRVALERGDRAQMATAFAHLSTVCNDCHQASGHGFIEVPSVLGSPVPALGPVESR